MDNRQFWLYLLVMAGSTYLIRAIPFSLVRKKIKNKFIRSFLFYIPFAVLSAMTLPSALYATDTVIGAAVGIAVAVVLSLWNKGLTVVAASACGAVLIAELLLKLL